VVSVDIDRRPHITHCADILQWDYKQYPSGYFDMITASPPCTNYSSANRKPIKDRDMTHSDQMVQKTIEIIDYFQPKYWLIENPQSGLLKFRPFMKDIPYTDVDYCRYGFPCRKRTRFWNNIPQLSLHMCDKVCAVYDLVNNRHKYQLCKNRGKNANQKYVEYKMTLDQRHAIPQSLIASVFIQTNLARIIVLV
jgi:site-specific DNA-cytosine methylase